MFTQATAIANEITDLENQLEARRQLLQTTATTGTTPIQELAGALHALKCHYNHTDGCSWEYEYQGKTPDWTRDAHKSYFIKALALTRENPNVPVPELTQILKTIKIV